MNKRMEGVVWGGGVEHVKVLYRRRPQGAAGVKRSACETLVVWGLFTSSSHCSCVCVCVCCFGCCTLTFWKGVDQLHYA